MGFRPTDTATASGSGFDFASDRRRQALESLKAGTSQEEQGQREFRGELTGLFRQRLQGLPQEDARRRGLIEAQSQRGLSQSLGQLRRQFGGSGLLGTQQFGRSLGGVVSEAGRTRAESLADLDARLRQEQRQELGLGLQAQQQLSQSGLAERGFQFQQGGSLAKLLQQQASGELQRQSSLRGVGLGGIEALGPTDLERVLGTGIDLFGRKLGGGGGAGGQVGGPTSGGNVGAPIVGASGLSEFKSLFA